MSKKNISEKNKYILSYLAVAFGGITFFSGQSLMKISFTLLLLLIFLVKGEKVDSFILVVGLIVSLIAFFQNQKFGNITIGNVLSFNAYYVVTPYLLLKIIGKNVFKYIIKIIVFYSIISLIFWSLSNISESFYQFTKNISSKYYLDHNGEEPDQQFILYTYEPYQIEIFGGIKRNPGPFDEPGAFGLFLILSLVLNIIINQGRIEKNTIVLFITILTTFSSATYLGLMILIGYKVYNMKIHKSMKFLYFIVFIGVGIYFFFNANFMGDKIITQYQYQMSVSLDTPTFGRFLGMRKAFFVLKQYPLFGRGLLGINSLEDRASRYAVAYGITSFASKIGIVAILAYVIYFLKGIYQFIQFYFFDNRFLVWAIGAMLMVMLAQSFFLSPYFMMIVFYSLVPFNRKVLYEKR